MSQTTTDQKAQQVRQQQALASAIKGTHYSRAKGSKGGQLVAVNREPGRNDICPCGSGKKFKACCRHVQRQRFGFTVIRPDANGIIQTFDEKAPAEAGA